MATVQIKSIKPAGGGNYTTLLAWEAAERANLVTANLIKVAEIYGGGSAGWVSLSSSAYTTDSGHYLHIRAAPGEGHVGIFDINKAFIDADADYNGINVALGWTRIGPGICIQSNGGTCGAVYITEVAGNTPCLIDGLICRSQVGTAWCFGIWNGGILGAGATHIIQNCAIHKIDTNLATTYYQGVHSVGANSFVLVRNCTIYVTANSSSSGPLVTESNGTITSQNNYLFGPAGGVCYRKKSNSGTMNKGTNDATSNTEALTAALRSVAFSTANFVNVTPGSEDFHLTATSALLKKGADLGAVSTDFMGNDRLNSMYDIGAHQKSRLVKLMTFLINHL